MFKIKNFLNDLVNRLLNLDLKKVKAILCPFIKRSFLQDRVTFISFLRKLSIKYSNIYT